MIKLVYKDEKLWNYKHVIWATLLCLVNSLTFWYVIIKVCFQSLMSRPPVVVSVIFLALMLADRLYVPIITKRFITFSFILDMSVWIMLLFSLFLPQGMQNQVSYLGLPVMIYLYDVIYLKEMLFDLVRRDYWVYKCYIVIKITYWFIMYSHLIGCIFYLIDQTLIRSQYFGQFSQNPQNYYQGILLAYTPIYMFDGFNRYVYAMYYSFALMSTIAFGDIIGKNYIQDAYVLVLIIMSTIVIALIIEQMYIIFRRKKTRYLELINRVRFLSERLKGYMQIPQPLRLQIINYLIDANWRYFNEYPTQLQTSNEFKTKIISQSIVNNPQLPTFYSKYLLHKLALKHLPMGIIVYNNVPQRQELVSYLVTEGQFWIGHATINGNMVGGSNVKSKGMNFGIQEALVGTNSLYPMLVVRTIKSASVLIITKEQIRQVLASLQSADFPCDMPIEHYQIAKDTAIFKRNKYKCSVCQKINPQFMGEHTLLNCPRCHLVIQVEEVLQLVNYTTYRSFKYRASRVSKKVRGLKLQTFEQGVRNWRLKQIQRFKDMMSKIREVDRKNQDQFETWFKWPIYGNQLGFNSQTHHFIPNYKDDVMSVLEHQSIKSPLRMSQMQRKSRRQQTFR